MSQSQDSERESPMIGSIFKFVSDWVGGDVRQPPPFRPRHDDTVIEMQALVGEGEKSSGDDKLGEWEKITDVDAFLEQIYAYYLGNGLYGVVLRKVVSLLIIAFLVVFSLFLLYAVNWNFVHRPATATQHYVLADVVHWSGFLRMSWIIFLALSGFTIIWTLQWIRLVQDLPNLIRIKKFYNDRLDIPEDEIKSGEFSEIMDIICKLQGRHPISADRLDARDICNRLMRRENYLIALFNKEIFNVDLPLPIRPSMTLTKTLEWNLSFCVLNYFFDEKGGIRKSFLKDVRRDRLSTELKRRFIAVGIANLILSPFIFIMLLAYLLFKYGEEIYRNPKTIATRQYNTAAGWKLREFNELPHLFERRLAHSQSKATKYMEQFGQGRWIPIARLIAFVAGSFALVLLVLTIANEDLLMHFEISPGKSIIWYLGLMGVILAISRAVIPDAARSHDPQKLMESIIEYTHYLPKYWRGQLHTERVHREFSRFYDYKFLILLNELIAVITTPFILIFALPKCSDRLVDFFREFTVHVDGIGHVCSFALFDFERHGNPKYGGMAITKYNQTKQGKMEKSFLSFVSNNPQWTPDDLCSQYLSRIGEFSNQRPSVVTQSNPKTKIPLVPSFRRSPLSHNNNNNTNHDHEDGPEEQDVPSGLISILNRYYDHHSSRTN